MSAEAAMALAAVIVPIIGGAIGRAMAAGDEAEAMRLRQEAADQYGPEILAEIDSWQPEQLGRSEMNGVAADPASIEAQREALAAFGNIARSGGLTPADRAALREIEQGEAQRERGNREAILGNMRQRGMGGSGFELAAALSSQQAGADRQGARDTDVAGMAWQRALDAYGHQAQLGGQMRGQSFDEGARIAQSNDAIAQWNAAARQDNRAQRFDAQRAVRGDRAGALRDMSDTYMDRGARTSAAWTGAGQAAGAGLGAGAQYVAGRPEGGGSASGGAAYPKAGPRKRRYSPDGFGWEEEEWS